MSNDSLTEMIGQQERLLSKRIDARQKATTWVALTSVLLECSLALSNFTPSLPAMATLKSDGLQALLNKLGVESFVTTFPSTDLLTRPLDIYRSHLADILVQLTACNPQVAYDSIQEPNDYGDLEVVIPKLRLKGSNPKELAVELAEKVCLTQSLILVF